MKNTINLMILIGAVTVTVISAQQTTDHPTTVSVQGVLRDNDGRTLADEDYEMTFQIYGNVNGTGNALWEEEVTLTVVNGVWSHTLGLESDNPLTGLNSDGTNYLKITVGTDALEPLTLLNLNPYETLNVTSGGNKVPATGNVGIGTTSPSEKLDVDGNIKLSGSLKYDGASNTPEIQFRSETNGDKIYIGGGGKVVVGAGESGDAFHDANLGDAEDLILAADQKISLFTGANSFANRVLAMDIGADGNIDVGGNLDVYAISATGDVTAGDDFHGKELHLTGKNIWFEDDMLIHGNGNKTFYFDSNNSDNTELILRDKEDTQYGRVYGSGNGSNFGLLDGDSHWSYLAVKDNYTEFRINNSVKMRIDGATGNVGIKTTSTGGGDLVIGGFSGSSSSAAGNAAIQFKGASTSGEILFQDQSGDPDICFGYNGGGSVAWINHNGSYGESSDRRLKENIEPIGSVLNKVMQLSPKSYNYKESVTGGNQATEVGFIAQDVQEHFPSIVDDDKEFLGLSYSKFSVLSIKAVQELKNEKDAEIESLNNQLAVLTQLVNDMQDQLNGIQK